MLSYSQFLNEMAKRIPSEPGDITSYLDVPNASEKLYSKTAQLKGEDVEGLENTKLHAGQTDPSTRMYILNDHANKKSIFASTIKTMEPNSSVPMKHIMQTEVSTKRDSGVPKGFGTNFIYNAWSKQPHPLASGIEQHDAGRDMWKRLVDRALDSGNKAYYMEPNNKVEINHQNKDELINRYFGDTEEHKQKHLVLSHTTL